MSEDEARNAVRISTHALREEGDVVGWRTADLSGLFLPTPSARRATSAPGREISYKDISTHALREEGDISSSVFGSQMPDFYPRPPRGGRPVPLYCLDPDQYISTHALREEGDLDDVFPPEP